MKFELEEPYKSKYRLAYLHTNNENRRMLVVVDYEGKHTSMAYAKYLYGVWLWKTKGKLIPEGLEVDHINDDKTDDRIENLQLITGTENRIKQVTTIGRKLVLFQCPICCKYFFRHNYRTESIANNTTISFCCKEHCSSFLTIRNMFNQEQLKYIKKQNQILIAREFKDSKIIIEEILNPYKTQLVWNCLNKE